MRGNSDSQPFTRMYEIMIKSTQVLSKSRYGVQQNRAASWNEYVYGNYYRAYLMEENSNNVVMQFFQRLFDLAIFLIVPVMIALAISWFCDAMTLSNAFQQSLITSGVLLLSGFFTGVFIGLKIAGEKGGILTLVLGMGALIAMAYFVFQESKGMELITSYFPFFHGSAPTYVAFSIPGAGLLGILFCKFFSIHPVD